MTATFDPTLPTAKDRMRYAVGDVDMSAALEQDETYAAVLVLHGEQAGVGVIAEALAARFAQTPSSISTGGDSIAWGDRVSTWLTLAKGIRGVSTGMAGSFIAGQGNVLPTEYRRDDGGTVWWTDQEGCHGATR